MCIWVCVYIKTPEENLLPFADAEFSLPQGAGWVLHFHLKLSEAAGQERSSAAEGGFVSSAYFVQWTSAKVNEKNVHTSQAQYLLNLSKRKACGLFIKKLKAISEFDRITVLEVMIAMISFLTFIQSSIPLPLPQQGTILSCTLQFFNILL